MKWTDGCFKPQKWHKLKLGDKGIQKTQKFLMFLISIQNDPKKLNDLLNWHLGTHKLSRLFYLDLNWRIIRRNIKGKLRTLYVPNKILRRIQIDISSRFIFNFKADNIFPATAYFKGCSIIRNAKHHRHNRTSMVVDIDNAFESITARQIYRFLRRKKPEQSEEIHMLISQILTYRGRLRLGSNSSPIIFNIMMMEVDAMILEMIKSFPGMIYTRYADDLCFSSPDEWFPVQEIRSQLKRILGLYALSLNDKQKVGRQGNMEFPGVFINNGRLSATMKVIRQFSLAKSDERKREGFSSFFKQFSRNSRKIIKKISNQIAQT